MSHRRKESKAEREKLEREAEKILEQRHIQAAQEKREFEQRFKEKFSEEDWTKPPGPKPVFHPMPAPRKPPASKKSKQIKSDENSEDPEEAEYNRHLEVLRKRDWKTLDNDDKKKLDRFRWLDEDEALKKKDRNAWIESHWNDDWFPEQKKYEDPERYAREEDPERYAREHTPQPKPLAMPEPEKPAQSKFQLVSRRHTSYYEPPQPAVHEESAPPDSVPLELHPPVETQISPAVFTPAPIDEAALKERIEQERKIYESIDTEASPPPVASEPPPAASKPPPVEETPPPTAYGQIRETRVKRLIKLSAMSREDKQKIYNEMSIYHVENPYYKRGGRELITYIDPKMKFRAKEGNVFEAVEAPPRRGKAPPPVAPPPPTETSAAPVAVTRVKTLAQLDSISTEDKAIIMNELKQGIDNPFYKIRGHGLGYKDTGMKKRARKVNVFTEIQAPPQAPPAEAPAEVPPPTADIGAAPSASEVAAVEKQVKPPPIKKRKLDLRREARAHDLTDKGFGGGGGGAPPPDGPPGPPTGGHRRLDLSGLSGVLDL
jgi:hypothetical protein